jgi:hypothetical protein
VGRDDVGCSGVGGEAFVYVQVRFLYFNIIWCVCCVAVLLYVERLLLKERDIV